MKKFVCPVCGYVYEGESIPEGFKCPVCKVDGSKFVEQKGDMKLAAQHEFGIYDKTVANNPDVSDADKAYILEQLKANFSGECSEVGMYLCMARIAHRRAIPKSACTGRRPPMRKPSTPPSLPNCWAAIASPT